MTEKVNPNAKGGNTVTITSNSWDHDGGYRVVLRSPYRGNKSERLIRKCATWNMAVKTATLVSQRLHTKLVIPLEPHKD